MFVYSYGSGSMSACVAWSGEYGNTRRRFYDPERGYQNIPRLQLYLTGIAARND